MSKLLAAFSLLCVSILTLFQSIEAFAEEPAPQVLEEVVVTATKTPVPVSQLTSAVEVIKGEELEQKKIKTVIDALRLAQGLSVFTGGGPGAESPANVRIRGANSTHTLVVIDGTIVNSPTTGAFDFSSLTTDNIERIEILRGAQSMVWGSDAIGGVINIITKKGTGTPKASAFVEYGSFATLREGAQTSGAKGPIDFSVSLSRWDTSSFSAANYRRGATERDPFHSWQGSSRVGLVLPQDAKLDFNVRWWNSNFNFDDTNADVFGSKAKNRSVILSGVFDQPLTTWWSHKVTLATGNERNHLEGGAFQRDLSTGAFGPASPFIFDLETWNRRIEWQHNFQVAKPLLLTAGYQFREAQASGPDLGPVEKIISTHAGFVQSQVNYDGRFLLTMGVRQDSFNTFGDATTYRTTAGYLLPDIGTKFRGSYGIGFHAPTINDLFFPGFSNPTLKPEKSQSLDVGVEQRLLKDQLQLSAGYFWNRFRNLIQLDAFFVPQNIGLAKSQGWEVGLTYALFKNFDLRGQYTYTLTRNLTTGTRLARWPVDQASAGISYQPMEPVRVNVDYRFAGARYNDAGNTQKLGSFGVVNMSATYDVTKQWQIFGRIDNLFDQQYEEVLTFGTPIRSVYGGVKFTY
jgi:vitamin B12 transporter